MKSTQPPDKADELKLLSPLLAQVYESTEGGCEWASQQMESLGKPTDSWPPKDPWCHSNMVRWYVKAFLTDPQRMLKGLVVEDLPLGGLSLIYLERHIKLWKGNGEDLPIVGDSSRRQIFLSQGQLPLFDRDQYLDIQVKFNEVLTYTTRADGRFMDLYLSCPAGFDSKWAPPDVSWIEKLQSPGQSGQLAASQPMPGMPADDTLPIEYPDEQRKKREQNDKS